MLRETRGDLRSGKEIKGVRNGAASPGVVHCH